MGVSVATQQTAQRQCANPLRSASHPGSRAAGIAAPPLHRLQRTVGNRAISRLLHSRTIQPKLTVSHPEDEHEREADRVADQVMRNRPIAQRLVTGRTKDSLPASSSLSLASLKVQASSYPRAKEPNEDLDAFIRGRVQLQSDEAISRGAVQRSGGNEGFQAPAEVSELIESQRGKGAALSTQTQTTMGRLFGRNFSDVRVHTDQTASRLNKDLSARAFTVGTDIFFSSGSYQPGSVEGKKVLGHELTHVIQQTSGRVSGGVGLVRPAGDVFEQEADATARAIERDQDTAQPQIHAASIREGSVAGSCQRKSAPVQRDLLDDIGGVASRYAAIVTNPVGALFSGAWLLLPDRFKPRIINTILDALDEVLSHLSAIFIPVLGLLWPLVREALLGFLRRIREVPDNQKIAMSNRFANLMSGGSVTFMLHFLKGMALGLWDIVRLPYDLVVGIIDGVKFVTRLLKNLGAEDLEEAVNLINTSLAAAWEGLRDLALNPSRALSFIETLWDSISGAMRQMGRGIAQTLSDMFRLSDATLGETIGRVAINIVADVVLAVVTEGIATVLRRGIEALAEFSRLFRAAVRVTGTILSTLRSIVAPLIQGFARLARLFARSALGRWLTRLMGFLDRILLVAGNVMMIQQFVEEGLAEQGTEEDQIETTIEGSILDLPQEPANPINRLVIQRNGEVGTPFENRVRQMLLEGNVPGMPQMDHVIPGQYNPSGHGIDLFAFRRDQSGRLTIWRIEVKGIGSEIKTTSSGIQTGAGWTRNAIRQGLRNPALREELMRATNIRNVARLERRLLEARSVLIAPRRAVVKGLRLLRRIRRRFRPRVIPLRR